MQFLGYDFLLDKEKYKFEAGQMPQISRMKEDCDYAREIPEPSDKVKLYAAKNCTWTNLPIQYFKNSKNYNILFY